MSWLLPSALGIGAVAILATVALHFIARSRPLAEPLPTARFIPHRPIRARTRSIALSDLLLLIVRAAAIAALALAVAGPVVAAAHGRTARVVLVDRSRSVGSIATVRDSARAVMRTGDALLVFDSSARAARSVDSLSRSDARGSLSAGLAAAVRAGATLASRTDSLELVIVSPFAAEEIDSATARIRALWHGRARLVRVPSFAGAPAVAASVESSASPSDPVIAGLSLLAPMRPRGAVRIVRGTPTPIDSAWVRDSARVLVIWPSSDTAATWPARANIDAVGGVASATGVLVGRFPRVWALDGRAVARWPDGDPAAVERSLGRGCVRDVGILVDPSSDVTLRPSFRDFSRALVAPCDAPSVGGPVDAAAMGTLAGTGALASAASLVSRDADASRWAPWLLALGAALLLLELALRRMNRTPA